ncbi:MAG: T9SS type A sorting domain-containing protein [Bacteroidaceae bacterium]
MNRKFTRWLLCMLLSMCGSVSWALDQVGGVYQIGTAQELAEFAALVNGGERFAKAVITADIDYTDQTEMVGSATNSFYGTLDGQGHTVTVNLTGSAAPTGLVAYLMGTVRNLRVSGTITSAFKNIGGVVGYVYGGMVQNCYCDATLNCSVSGDASCGGIVASTNSGSVIDRCVFAGTITGKDATNCGGIVGWAAGTTMLTNCLAIGDLNINMTTGTCAISRSTNAKIANCYAMYGFQGTVETGTTLVTTEQLASGEVAFSLGMGQKLGTDAIPSPQSADKVYASAETCSGEGATGFTNVKDEAQMPAHTYDGFTCSVCGAINEEFMTPEDGVYKISTPEQMDWLARMVNSGHPFMDVKLMADIDMSAYPQYAMIGTTTLPYRGHFDGQHHKVSNLTLDYPEASGVGLFCTIGAGSVVENLTLDNTCSLRGQTHIGLIGHSQGAGYITLRGLGNMGSVAAVPTSEGGSSDAGVGGIIGNSPQGCLGQIDNCWFVGTIPSGMSCAYISGWTGSNQFTMTGCWAVSESTSIVNVDKPLARTGSGVAIANCATIYGNQGTLVTSEQVASGELCYIVNGKSSENPVWYQTLGTDPYPTLTGTDVVYIVGSKNCDGTAGDSFGFSNVDKGFIQDSHQIDPSTGFCTVCGQPDRDEDGYILVGTPLALRWVAEQINTGSMTSMDFRLTSDIDLSGENWTPIGDDTHPFVGNMDGGRHTISNMIVESENVAGLFGTVNSGSLHDLLIDATCSVKGATYAGGLVGHTYGGYKTEIYNVGVMCPVTNTGSGGTAAAGIIGNANAGNVTNITNCFSTGLITSSADVACISGWQGNVGSKITNCWSVSEISQHTGYNFCRGGSTTQIVNCYCSNEEYKGALPATYYVEMNADMLSTGELCYIVNGRSSENPVWYQNIDEDFSPVPWDDHKVVYAVGTLNCDGSSAGGSLTYSNENQSEIPPHDEDHGVCVNCGAVNKDYKKPVGGFYELADAEDVVWFSRMVNSVDNTINGCLTDDVDFSGCNDRFEQMGKDKKGYGGIFDGQNHTVSGLNIDVQNDDAGFICASNSGMVLRNIIFDSTCSIKSTGNYVGIIGASNWDQTGTTTIQNVANEGDVTTGGVNAGGLLGGNHGSKGIIIMRRCYTTGSVVSNGNGESAALAGWIGASGSSVIESCWTTADVTGMEGTKEAYRGTASVKNCFSTQGGQFTQFDPSEVSTGSLTWKLNVKSFLNAQWYQDLHEGGNPTWVNGGLVYASGEDTYECVYDQDSYEAFRDYVITSEKLKNDETIACDSLLVAYASTLDELEEVETLDEFLRAYAKEESLRTAIKASVALYLAYEAQAEYAIAYINNNTFECEEAERLKAYLTEEREPDEEFLNGTYRHIMSTHQLNDAAIVSETEFVKNLLSAAIAADYQPGADITDLMVNANLDAGREGWDIQTTNTAYPVFKTVEGIMTAGEFWNSRFSMTQTLKGLKPGVYMLQSNATFRPGGDGYSKLHAGQVMLGKNINFAMTEVEDAIKVEDAVDLVNCNLSDSGPDYKIVTEDGEVYIPQGPTGCAYAFKASRYPNFVAVQIEEGDSLVVGVRNQGTGMERDWMGFGNFHLIYLGTAAEGQEQLALALQNYLGRARTIDAFEFSDGADFMQYPNYSKALKAELTSAIAAAEAATEGEEMMQLIDRFSEIFQQIYECRTAYVAMAKAAEELSSMASSFYNQGIFDENSEELDYINGLSDQMWGHYSNGTVSAEEALDLANNKYQIPVLPAVEDGYYMLGTPKDLVIFSAMVNGGMNGINAKLTADLDMTGIEAFQPIGYNIETDNSSATEADKVTYKGVFDGQGHRISNLTVNHEASVGVGLFGTIITPAVIKNIVLDATCSLRGYDRVGLVGRSNNSGVVTLSCLGNEGSVEAVYQAAAGILGNANNGSLANFNDCYSAGSIKAGNGKNAAQICGWLGASGGTLVNCWSTAEIEGYDSQSKLFCRYSSNVVLTNCYSTDGDGTQASLVTAEDFVSGKITWALNGEKSEAPVWYQKLGTDLHPVFDASHGVVIKNADGTFSNAGGDAVEGVLAKIGAIVSVYDVQGRQVRSAVPATRAMQGLPKGMYILRGTSVSRKVMVK